MAAMTAKVALTRKQWAKRINTAWQELRSTAVKGFFRLGRDLTKAKADLEEHGQWLPMVREDLEMTPTTAQAFMRIATSQMLSNAQHLLPPDWTTCLKLTRLEPGVFEKLIGDGTICPEVKRNEVAKILRLERVAIDERRVLDLVPIVGKFRTIVLDPAWEYSWLSLAGRAKPGYFMQTLDQLAELDVAAWADDEAGCQLYCWATNNFMGEAERLVAHWGFQHRTVLTWIKPSPFGLGSYFRNSTEHAIFATRGKTTTRHAAASMPTHFEAPRGEHSEKPEKFYEIVRAASYPPYGEGNQRAPRPDFVNLYCPATEQAEAAE
jgi:N6-adenosine-specific RNA methylase IME4